ncbi:MAG: galactosyldiacylglycerol synthase, partial [Gammaproteobacteria bacterium]|nr:galactosyldiacylglycerol synthase [Gammaproteobacteria bacterium]
AGGGHRAAALALAEAIGAQGRPWEIRLVNLFEVLDPRDRFQRATGMKPEAYYNARLKRGWTIGLSQELRILQGLIRLGHRRLVAQLTNHWRASAPDLVVSLVPNFNRAMYAALAQARPGAGYVTVLTDFADFPPHFWIERGQDQHLVCGTARAVAQAKAAGYADHRIHPVSGMIIRPSFYAVPPFDRDAEMVRLGLDPRRPTGVVTFGGQGSRAMRSIARRLAEFQLILLCGHNRRLAERLRKVSKARAHVVVEFTPRVQEYLRLADFCIGKPGPGSISEAVQMGLPMIVARNAWTMPQERYNADWIVENDVGVVLESFRGVREAVEQLLEGRERQAGRARAIRNRAVFEIPAILAKVIEERERATVAASGRRVVAAAAGRNGGRIAAVFP